MHNYNFLQIFLHKLALSSQLMREATFDVENSLISPKQSSEDNVFITGLARSGSTILLNSLYKSNLFSSLTYSDMPFVLAPNLWSKISSNYKNFELKERAHGDGIKFSIQSPEAFEEVFWKTFNHLDPESIDKFRAYINNIKSRYNKDRYLSKNNQNIKRLELLSDNFPKGKILIPFRQPIQHAYSLLTQHKKFLEYSKKNRFVTDYMCYIGHTEFGPNYESFYKSKLNFFDDLNINHWLEQWYLSYQNILELEIKTNNIFFVSYESLCRKRDYWLNILKILNINEKYEFHFKESKKDFPPVIDNELKDKALDLFSKLNQHSNSYLY